MVLAETPNTADWMQGWGAIVSLPLSLLAVLFTGWLLRHEIKARKDERAEQQAAQARLVRILRADDNSTENKLLLKVRNSSSEAIYNVYMFSYAPGSTQAIRQKSDYVSSCLDAETELLCTLDLIPSKDPWNAGNDKVQSFTYPIAVLSFEDADGRRWVRPQNDKPYRWLGPHMASYKSNRTLLTEYLGTWKPFNWIAWRRWSLDFRFRRAIDKRMQKANKNAVMRQQARVHFDKNS